MILAQSLPDNKSHIKSSCVDFFRHFGYYSYICFYAALPPPEIRMRKFLGKLWNKANEPHIEKALIVILPFVTLVVVALILAPSLLSLLGDAASGAFQEPPVQSRPPMEEEGFAHISQVEQQAMLDDVASPSPAPSPTPSPLPSPETVEQVFSGPLTGWQEIGGITYYYDENGVPLTGLQQINGQLYFFDQYGQCASELGIDVSTYNGFINWPAVAAQGIDYAILRAGGRGWETGLIYDDDWFQRNLMEARIAGIELGVYFFSTATNPAEAQQEAAYVLHCLGGTKLEMPIFIDVEYSGDYPHGRADKLSNTQREVIINAFCRTVMDAGYKAGVYSGEYYYKYNLDYDSLGKYTIWLASYTKSARLPNFPGRYDMWQFTDGGLVNGITGIVDMNASF